jgi:hypothetical protein
MRTYSIVSNPSAIVAFRAESARVEADFAAACDYFDRVFPTSVTLPAGPVSADGFGPALAAFERDERAAREIAIATLSTLRVSAR